MPLFEELGQTSQDSRVSGQMEHRSWDVCPNSPKSGKSILPNTNSNANTNADTNTNTNTNTN